MTSSAISRWAERAERALERFLPDGSGPAGTLEAAMRYACLGGGKRLRATLVYATGDMLGTPPELLDRPAAAIEMIHAYSLVHDDLPAMDDDDLRRGKPTCHRAFDEATAILAGDALQSLAFEVLCADPSIAPGARAAMVRVLAEASGARGMAGGQALDLGAVGTMLDVDALAAMHGLKTGALIRAAVRLGALCGDNADAQTLEQLDAYAGNLGFAFQIVDDILDEVMDSGTLGKTGGADRARGKPTYTSMTGLDEARATVDALHRAALESLRTIRHNTGVMGEIADFVTRRTH